MALSRTIYRHKDTGKSYEIEILKVDMKFANCGERLGVYAYPYLWDGDVIFFKSKDFYGACVTFVEDNFEPIAIQ